MWIKNNSENTWDHYNCGNNVVVDIKPGATFEIEDQAGEILLRNLGAPAWLVKIDPPANYHKEEVKVPTEEEKVLDRIEKESYPKKR